MTLWEVFVAYHPAFLGGLGVTLQLCLLIWPIGLTGGAVLGSLAYRFPKAMGRPARVGSFVLTGIPVLVLLFWLHYPAQTLIGVRLDGFVTTIAALGIVNVFAVADLFRHALDEFPDGYIDAARVAGIPPRAAFTRIQLPLIARQVIPGLITIQVVMLQATLFASLISVNELFRVAQRINAQIYRPVEVYTILAAVFLLICLPLNGVALLLRRRFRRRIRVE